MCVKKPLKMANDRRNGALHVTLQLIITLQLRYLRKFTARDKTILSFIYLFIYLFILAKVAAKVATANPFVSKERR